MGRGRGKRRRAARSIWAETGFYREPYSSMQRNRPPPYHTSPSSPSPCRTAPATLARLAHPFRILVFDWDGTAVAHRTEDAAPVRQRIELLLRRGVFIAVISGTSVQNIDRQLSASILGPHKQRLYLCTNRGSEVYGFDAHSHL